VLNLTVVDWLILLLYFVFVLGIGNALKPHIDTARDFLQTGRTLPAWICGLAFLAASLSGQEVIGMGAWGARYGLENAQLVALGAVVAMIVLALVLMPLYYGSKVRSVPEFLGLRFDRKTRTLNACLFAAMTVFSSGLSLYIVARAMQALHVFDGLVGTLGWSPQAGFTVCIVLSAAFVLAYLLLGGLTGAIYNQVLQFFLLFAGLLPAVFLGLRAIGGWSGLKAAIPSISLYGWNGAAQHSAGMNLETIGLDLAVGLLFGAGYWCTDFRVIQTALAAKNLESARRTPLIAAIPRLLLPFLVVLPGLLAIALPTPRTSTVERTINGEILRSTTVVRPEVEAGQGLVPAQVDPATGKPMVTASGESPLDYYLAAPSMLVHFLPTGLLGLALAALLACLMSGMAAGATAFNTVFTYDLYQPCIRKDAADGHYLAVARWATVAGILLSVATAYATLHFTGPGLNIPSFSILVALGLAFALVNAPLLASLLLGMFSRRATGHGAFAGLVAGAAAALLHLGLTLPVDGPADAPTGLRGGWIAVLHRYPSTMAQVACTVIVAFTASLIVTVLVSSFTKPRPEPELAGLVYSLTPRPARAKVVWWKRPEALAVPILLLAVGLAFLFA
jgi:SSS family solute:Na+ symporter